MHPLLISVRDLQLPAGDYAIFGSGPMLVRNIITEVNDIDIICRGAAWQKAQERGELVRLDDYDVDVVSIEQGRITIGTSWGIGDFDVDKLINSAETIRGLPFVRLEHVVAYKKFAKRAKDIAHLALLAEHWRCSQR